MDISKDNGPGKSALYEEAITLTSYGKYNYLLTIVGGFTLMISLLAIVDITYILPASECELNLEKKDRGILSGAYFIGVIVSSHLLGFLSDVLGRRYIIIRSLFINLIVYIVTSFSPNFWFLLIMRFITGIVLCGVLTCGLVYVSEFHSNKQRSRAVMILSSLACTAFVYCACIGWLILANEWSITLFGLYTLTPWRLYYVILGGVPSLIIGTIFFFLPESPKFLLACNRNKEAIEILKKVYRINTGKPKDDYPVIHLIQNPNELVYKLTENSKTPGAVIRMIWNQTYPLFMPPHLLNMLFSCMIFFSLFYSFTGILIWIPDILNQLLILKDDPQFEPLKFCHVVESNWTANLERIKGIAPTYTNVPTGDKNMVCNNTLKPTMFILNTGIGLTLTICSFIAAFIILRVNRKAFISILCFLCIVVYAVLLEFQNTYVMIVCLAWAIISLNIIFCSTSTLIVDYFPTNYRAMAVCLIVMTGRLGSAVGGDIFSLFLLQDCRKMFYIAGGILFLGGVSCISLQSPKTNSVAAKVT